MSHNIIDRLKELNAKERYWLLWNAVGNEDDQDDALIPHITTLGRFELSKKFTEQLEKTLNISIPRNSFWAMDYHLDWLLMVKKSSDDALVSAEGYSGSQQDIDLLIAFQGGKTVHMILLEAKGITPWNNRQLELKTERLKGFFGDEENLWPEITPHFVLASPKKPMRINSKEWPKWAKGHDNQPLWIELMMPKNLNKATRCKADGTTSKLGESVKLTLRQ